MFLVQRVFTRQNAGVPFYKPTDAFMAHYKTTYMDSGKILSSTVTISEDKLKQVITTMWKDEPTWNEYLADSVCQAHFNARNAYHDGNGIANDRSTSIV